MGADRVSLENEDVVEPSGGCGLAVAWFDNQFWVCVGSCSVYLHSILDRTYRRFSSAMELYMRWLYVG